MSYTNLLAQHITEIYEGGNWTDVCIAQTLEGISFQQAQQVTNGSPNTIASLLHHLYYWNGVIMQRLNGNNPSIPQTNGFEVGELKNEQDWEALKEKTHQSFLQLADAVKYFSEEKFDQTYAAGKTTYFKNMQGIIEHAYYHLGQIVILKNIIKK